MLETSTTTAKLDEALAKVQGELKPAVKGKENEHFKSSYADIAAVWGAARESLSKHGISVTQWPLHATDNRLHILTRIAHGGEWMKATFSLPVTKADPQGYGSAVTYAKRFTLAAAIGIVSEDEDDDGNAASRGRVGVANQPRVNNQQGKPQARGPIAPNGPASPGSTSLPDGRSSASAGQGASSSPVNSSNSSGTPGSSVPKTSDTEPRRPSQKDFEDFAALVKDKTREHPWNGVQVTEYMMAKYKAETLSELNPLQFAELKLIVHHRAVKSAFDDLQPGEFQQFDERIGAQNGVLLGVPPEGASVAAPGLP